MARKPTATDVANQAKVSRSAVSLVLGGRAKEARIGEDAEARIRQAAADLHYKPNASAQGLASGRTETIGLVIRDLSLLSVDPYLLPLLSGILHRARGEGFRVLVESVASQNGGDPYGDLMDSGRIDGMIVENPDYGDRSLRRLIQAGRPVVVLGSQGLEEEWSVAVDDEAIGRQATEHLIGIGRRRIAHLAYCAPGIFASDRRRAGFLTAMAGAGLDIADGYVVEANFSMASGYSTMSALLKSRQQPDAVFVSSDAVALGAMAAIHDAGLSIPADIAIASIDDIDAAAFSQPPLTTVPSKPYETGEAAGDMLMALMANRKPRHHRRLIKTELIVRGSTDHSWRRASATDA